MATTQISQIRLPAIRSVDIGGYALFPGPDGTGISHRFPNGVTVVAGINGLGKTTLLNALLRSLLGPADAVRENPGDVGSTSHQLVAWRQPSYFGNRVPDAAAGATISVRVSFGAEVAYVVRNLRDLSIEQLRHGDQALPATEESYRRLAVSLSGVDSFYDFHFLVRNLLFYLEDRRPLVWTEDAQFEMARILFVPGAEATSLGTLYDDIKSLDSRYRNLLTESNRLVRRLQDQKRAEGGAETTHGAIAALKDAYVGTQAALETTNAAIQQAIDAERATSDEVRRTELDLEGLFREYEGMQRDFLASAFRALQRRLLTSMHI